MSRKTRKLIWSAPLVAVFAVVGALAIFAAQAPNVALAHDPPGAVTGLTLEVVNSMEVKLTWTAPTTGGAVDNYRIDKSDEGLVWTLLTDTVSGDSTTYTDDTLEFTGIRFYRVFAVNDSGTGAVSEPEGAQTEASTQPGRVTGLRAAAAPGNAGRKEIVLTWNRPASTGGSPIEKYHVYYTTPGAAAFEDRGTDATGPTITAGTTRIAETEDASLTYTHKAIADGSALTPNSSYRYRVYAVNKAGQVSAMASDTRGATTKKVGPPAAPTGLTAVPTGTSGQVQLYWYHPADDGGQNITNFRIHQKSGTQTWQDPDADPDTNDQVSNEIAKTAASVTEATITGLTDDTSYEFRVYSVTGTGTDLIFSGGYAGTVKVTPVSDQAVPDAPTFTGERDPKGVVTLNWTRATDVLSYRIDVSDNGWEWNKLIESTGFTDAQYTYKDPKRGDGVERHYRMFARNRHGYSGTPNAITVGVADATAPGMVRDLTATPDPNDPTKINLNWMAPSDDGGAVVAGYCIDYAVIERPSFVQLMTDHSPDFDAQVLSTVVPADATPCADTDVVDVLTTADDAVGARVKIEVKIPEAGDLPSAPTTYTVEDLKAQDTVQFRVISQNLSIANTRMYSTFESADLVTATTIKAAQPNMPQDLTAEAARDSNLPGTANLGVNLLWNVPEAVHGGNIAGYRIQVHYDAIRWWDSLNCAEMNTQAGSSDTVGEGYCQMYAMLTDAQKAVVMGAYNKAVSDDKVWMDVEANTGTIQTFDTHRSEPASDEVRMYRIAAIDNAAVTKQSEWSNVVTYPVQMHTHNTAPTTVGTIDPVTVTAGMSTDAKDVSGYFSDPNMDDLTYTAAVMPDDGSIATADIPAGSSMLTITGVAVGSATVTVTATDMDGESAMQEIAVTVIDVPGMPTIDMVESSADGTMLTVTWTAPTDIGGSAITGYEVMYKMTGSDADYMSTSIGAADDGTIPTSATISDLSPNTNYSIAVVAVNAAGNSDMGMGSGMTNDIVPGMPTGLSAMKNADMPTSQIDLSWTAPTDNGGSTVTHYIIERRYEGDMMGDIPSDGYNDAVDGASFAFFDHKGWWETLNCKGMLRVFGSDADPDMDSDDKAKYCAHYAMSGPTADMTFENPIADGSELDMEIEALFDKRYVITSDAMTTHSDMDLMDDTTYTYRVSAVNAAGRSSWSAADMATTDSGALMAPTNIRVNPVGSGGVIVAWDSVSGATGYRIIAINVNNVDETHSEFVNNPTAMGGGLDGLTPGQTYNIFVASFDDADPPNYSLQPRFRQIVAE